ncbi:helix-turn-helix domain-containing protein [Streptomyces lateritius]|uniref:Helix-turn-helix domain-containing protein n=1 Tax=Streptomyces lateritius TaxID=67313 RepID=A0ABW6YJD7_9ACTN
MKPTGKEVEPKDRAFGQKIKQIRQDRGLTQTELATRMGRTSSWMSQVERGVQKVDRLDVLQGLADALSVSVQQLRPGAPSATEVPPQPDVFKSNDLDEARTLISGHPAIGTLLGALHAAPGRSLAELSTDVDELWQLTHAGAYADVTARLTELLPALEQTVRSVAPDARAEAYLLLARMYQATSSAFQRQDASDAAWVAADRAIWAAELSGEPLHVCAGVFRMVHAFARLDRLDQAEHAARTAIQALTEADTRDSLPPEGLSALGALHLALAHVYAKARNRAGARTELEAARQVAARLGEDRNDLNLEFGPTNVEIQAVSAAVQLGDAGEALDIGATLNVDALSPERQGRLFMDLGRAHAQRRQVGEALDCLLRAEQLDPDMVRGHHASRSAIKDLVLLQGADARTELMELARRADALE